MKRTLAAPAALVIAVTVAGCAPDHGEVIGKRHEDAYVWFSVDCKAWGSKGDCVMYGPTDHYVPEAWHLCIRDDNDHTHTGCLDVDRRTWTRYETGQHYPDAR